jgi:DNA modification methylase
MCHNYNTKNHGDKHKILIAIQEYFNLKKRGAMSKITDINIKLLEPYEKNPRKIDKNQFNKLVKSISEDPGFFTCRPCLVKAIGDKYLIYAGNQRYRAAKHLKWETVPCIITTATEEQIRTRMVQDNIHHGEFDWDILANEYDPSELLDMGMMEKDLFYPDDVTQVEPTEDEDDGTLSPCDDKDAITKLGDVIILNNHRLVCGDSTLPDTVSQCLDGAEPILMVTDPPYGVNYDPSWRGAAGKGQKANGVVQNDDKVNWALAWHLFPGSVAYVWHAGKYCSEVQKSLEEAEFEIISQIIWSKQHFALSRGDYHWQHEPCWYAAKKGCKHNWQGSRKESTLWEIGNLNCFGKSQNEDERTSHSTQKPIECMERPIRNNTEEGQGVYDPFLGSGTTLIAAEKTDRICYGIEFSPAYCDVIINRWKNFMIKNNREYSITRNGEAE